MSESTTMRAAILTVLPSLCAEHIRGRPIGQHEWRLEHRLHRTVQKTQLQYAKSYRVVHLTVVPMRSREY